MKKICFVHNVAEIGGAERMTQTIIKGLPEDTFESYIVCPEQGPMIDECQQLDALTQVLPFSQPDFKTPLSTLRNFLGWFQFLRKNNIDVIHTGDLICTRSLMLAAKKCKVPVICHMHFPFKQSFVDWVFSKYAQPSGFIFCSNELKNDVGGMLALACPEAEQWVIHNGVDIEKFSNVKKNNKLINIGIIANLQERKGHKEFLEMAKIVSTSHYNVHFDIIGGDILEEPREPFLQNMCKQLKLEEKVTFHGQVSNVLPLLQKLDIVVCASYQEAFPVSILEAMSCEKVVVSTNVNGIPEAIIEGETGFMVKPNNAAQLALAVVKLLNDPERLIAMGQKGRKRVVENFSEQRYLDKIIYKYQKLTKS